MSERLGRGEAAFGGAEHAFQQFVASLIEVDLAAQNARDIDIDVLAHGAHRARIGRQFDHRQDRVADDVSLARGEEVNHKAGGGAYRVTISAAAEEESMNHKPGPVGASALSRAPITLHFLPIFWMLPSAFSSMVVRPPSMLPLVGCESHRSLVLWSSTSLA